MTTTDILGTIQANGILHQMVGEPTDAAAESVLLVRDIAGATGTIGAKLRGQILERLSLQASDGSVLTSVNLYDGKGAKILSMYGGERVASSQESWNIDLRGLKIPIDEGMTLKVVADD